MTDGDGGPVLFVHVMKTSGTTFLNQLLECLGPDRVWPMSEGDAPGDEVRRYHLPAVLLAVPAEDLAANAVISAHVPAVVADVLTERIGRPVPSITMLREPVARVVSHIRQVRAELGIDDPLEAVYDDLRAREPFFVDHQTKVFSARRHELTEVTPECELGRLLVERRDEIAAVVAEHGADHLTLPGRLAEVMPDTWDAGRMEWGMVTPPPWWVPIDEGRLAEAKDRLDAMDVVGVAERHDDFVDAVAARFGWDLGPTWDRRVSADADDVPASLRRRILEDSAHDVALYEHALRRAA